MKKIRLLGMKRSDTRVEFILEKNQQFVRMIHSLVHALTRAFDLSLFVHSNEKTGKESDEQVRTLIDTCVHREYPDYEFDMFFGRKKIILIIRSPAKKQQQVVNLFFEQSCWKTQTKTQETRSPHRKNTAAKKQQKQKNLQEKNISGS